MHLREVLADNSYRGHRANVSGLRIATAESPHPCPLPEREGAKMTHYKNYSNPSIFHPGYLPKKLEELRATRSVKMRKVGTEHNFV
jgi:hypothetical protein